MVHRHLLRLTFFLIPFVSPIVFPPLRDKGIFHVTTPLVRSTRQQPAAPADVRRRAEEIAHWDRAQAALAAMTDSPQRAADLARLGTRPTPLTVGQPVSTVSLRGGESVFWSEGVKPVDRDGRVLTDVALQPRGRAVERHGATEIPVGYPATVALRGFGNFRLDFLLYHLLGVKLGNVSEATLSTLELVPKIILPFVVMILISLITKRNHEITLMRYYAKMKTPVTPDRTRDERHLVAAYSDPAAMERKKLFPGSSLEFQKPTLTDIIGLLVCFAICYGIVAAAMLVASLGQSGGAAR